jgi:hypothetical protein
MRIREALLAGPLGFGTAPLGNMDGDIPEDEAPATVDAAWDAARAFSMIHDRDRHEVNVQTAKFCESLRRFN